MLLITIKSFATYEKIGGSRSLHFVTHPQHHGLTEAANKQIVYALRMRLKEAKSD